ncbi:MAG: sodium:proton antiporter [Streptococcaceae bacterium]|jgi:CPA1 family monovalent cation:H+ antiporter|nr:sodium:proton antiporter [Streptococcaceae bacterium]MCH4175983.1 sodium:proton antiporter [Streptococcaceae bacterium]
MAHLILYLIIFFITILFSNVLNKVFPKIPLPLIQIIFGVILGMLGAGDVIHMDSEIFLALIIAPLLFRDAEIADISFILKHWKIVFYLVIPVVFVSVFVMGGMIHQLLPAIPFAACFAVGAALGPTDAVAVESVGSRFEFPKRVKNILKGEGLVNDASGIIAFQFAIATLTTGYFSVVNATWQLLLTVAGGVLIGLLTAWVSKSLTTLLEEMDAHDSTGYLLLELLLPFVSFFVAEEFHVSGIIAAVVAGVSQSSRFKKISLFDAKVDVITNSFWNMIGFILNAVVFVLFGLEMSRIVIPTLQSPSYSNLFLLSTIVIVTIVLFCTRFVLISLFYKITSRRRKQPFSRYMNDILLLTFSGVKGTVSIATILLTPTTFSEGQFIFWHRSMMLFIVSGVTLLSFLVGVIVLPLLSEAKETKRNHIMEIALLEEVAQLLGEEARTRKDPKAMYATIDNYRGRIQDLIVDQEGSMMKSDFNELRVLILRIEVEGLEEIYKQKQIDDDCYKIYQRYIKEMERFIVHKFVSTVAFTLVIVKRALRAFLHQLVTLKISDGYDQKRVYLTEDQKKSLRFVYLNNTEYVLEALENLEGVYDPKLIDYLQAERIRQAELLHERSFIDRVIQRYRPVNIEEMMRGYYLERKLIFEYEAKGSFTHLQAKELRQNVNELENYSLKDNYNNLPYEFFDYLRHHSG